MTALDAPTSVRTWKPYPAYKPSGVDWLGAVPGGWDVMPLKFVAPHSNARLDDKLPDLPYIGLQQIESRTGRLLLDAPVERVESTVNVFEAGCVLFGKLRPYLAKVAKPNFAGTCSTEILVLRPAAHNSTSYLHYLLLSPRVIDLVDSFTYGAKMPRASAEQIGSIRVPLPPLPEQRAIAAFLDRETAKLDGLVAKKEQLIELLREKRNAVISYAVGGGHSRHSPLRQSGIDWLGPIPAHWELLRLKHLLRSVEQGWSPQCENRVAEPDEWGVLKVGCVNGTEFDELENKALPTTERPRPNLEIRAGDLVMSRANTRELLGSISYVERVRPKLLLCDKLYRLRPDTSRVSPKYLEILMRSSLVRFQFERDATGASDSMQNIGQDTVRELLLPLPPLNEQEELVRFLKARTSEIDALIGKVREHIEKLREFRAALISAAVTGKIDVRDAGDGGD